MNRRSKEPHGLMSPSTPTFDADKASARAVEVGLNAAIIAVRDLTPVILEVDLTEDTLRHKGPDQSMTAAQLPLIEDIGALPFGPFDPYHHRTLEAGLRAWVEQQTALKLGYVEQLYTFGDRGRAADPTQDRSHEVSIGYLALTRINTSSPQAEEALETLGGHWRSWYRYFPWEDWRTGCPAMLDTQLLPALTRWADKMQNDHPKGPSPHQRLKQFFGVEGGVWDEERVLERYELLYEAGLVTEHFIDRGEAPPNEGRHLFGHAMHMDHRRILATAISRLRAKLKYRPVVFELMEESFTLTQLQATVEAISGRHLHKQNFRRLVEQGQLVEPTGATSTATGGRPAALFRFRRPVLAERPAPGLRLGANY